MCIAARRTAMWLGENTNWFAGRMLHTLPTHAGRARRYVGVRECWSLSIMLNDIGVDDVVTQVILRLVSCMYHS